MNKKHKKWNKDQHGSNTNESPADHSEAEADMVYTVRIQPDPADETRHTEQSTYQEQQIQATKRANLISGIAAGIAGVTLASLIIYACITYGQLGAMLESNKLTQQTLRVSQGAYVTIGRKDGVIADFVVPKNPNQNAEIVIYFQNSGHLPAKFVWGTMAAFLEAGGKKQSTGINYTHPFKGMITRTRDIKTGSIGEQGESSVIAGDSVFISTLGTISQKDLVEMPANNMGNLILGMFAYCDELGTYSVRSFGLRYRSNAPSSSLSFDLAEDSNFPILPLPKSTATTEYLPPCETANEREQNQQKKPN